MGDWPQTTELAAGVSIGPGSLDAMHTESLLTGTPASAAMGTTNVAVFYPFVANGLISNRMMWWANGGTVNGNVDVGVYDAQGVLLDHCTPQAQAGTNTIQAVVGTTNFTLRSSVYYMGLAWTSATATFLCGTSPIAGFPAVTGWRTLTGLTAGTLPASAAGWTLSAVTQMPLFGACQPGFR